MRQAAEAAALEGGHRKRCRIVREYLPRDRVAELVEARSTLGGRIRALGSGSAADTAGVCHGCVTVR